MTATKPAAQQLRDIFDRDSPPPFPGSGCNDHVTRRNLAVSAVGALFLLVVLLAILML